MLQELTIRTNDRATLEPILKAAIENEKKMLSLGLERTRQRLAEYEQQYGMTSDQFERRLKTLEVTETVAFSEWRMEIGLLRLLESQHRALQEAELA
jgi:16S rRNA A1518/A1519 N6-dimethyltransferase RsmA/KsgA/DIM1 with predicted DNA glycosylase/AP lyase activity